MGTLLGPVYTIYLHGPFGSKVWPPGGGLHRRVQVSTSYILQLQGSDRSALEPKS